MKVGFALQNSSNSHFSLLHFFVPFIFESIVFPPVFQLLAKTQNTSTWILHQKNPYHRCNSCSIIIPLQSYNLFSFYANKTMYILSLSYVFVLFIKIITLKVVLLLLFNHYFCCNRCCSAGSFLIRSNSSRTICLTSSLMRL